MIDPIVAYENEVVGAPLDPRIEEIVMEARDRAKVKDAEGNEQVAAHRELSNDVVSEYRWLDEKEFHDVEPRMGKLMTHAELITLLRNKCHLRCWYTQHLEPGKVSLRVQNRDGNTPPEIACWAQYGWMPEYSVVRFDEHGLPVNERYRGWRTVLLQLILGGYLSEESAHKAFGQAFGPASTRYNSTLSAIRNRK